MSIMPYKDITKRKERHKKYMREIWYPKNREKHIGYVDRIKKKISDFILDYKQNNKCTDCGFMGKEYPEVLEFDQIGNNKEFNISTFYQQTSNMDKVKKEIEKCELVCANCHRIRTFKRRK